MKPRIRLPHITPSRSFQSSKASRYIHQSCRARNAPLAESSTLSEIPAPPPGRGTTASSASSSPPALSLLAFPTLLRSYLVSTVSSSPLLLAPCLRFLSLLAHSTSPWLQRNPALQLILKQTFYKHFCAGETPAEVQRTAADLKSIGFKGVILAYAREIVVEKGRMVGDGELEEAKDVEAWKKGTMETVRLANRHGYAALKFSGAGRSAMRQLMHVSAPSATISQATTEICEYAKARGVKLLFDAEQHVIQDGIDQWTVLFQRKYNRNGFAIVYGTYQAYLRSAPAILAQHLAIARQEGFTLGVKLVRGAYLASDPRHLIWATKAETDRAFDGITESLMRKQWNDVLLPDEQSGGQPPLLPTVDLVLASHNHESVRKAISIRQEQNNAGEKGVRLAYGQLMGMADEVGCELIMSGRSGPGNEEPNMTERPQVYKYAVWGTVQECLKYLTRRAEENRDALARAKHDRNALGKELRRRLLLGY